MGLHTALLARCSCLLKIQKYLSILLFGDITLLKWISDMRYLSPVMYANVMLALFSSLDWQQCNSITLTRINKHLIVNSFIKLSIDFFPSIGVNSYSMRFDIGEYFK
jgi:hypothetical protein